MKGIVETDNLLRGALALRNSKWVRQSRVSWTLFVITLVVLAILIVLGLFGIAPEIVGFIAAITFIISFFAIFIYFFPFVSENAVSEAEYAVEEAQRKWVEAHGLRIPEDGFNRLVFPSRIPKEDTLFGVADLLEAGENGKLVKVVLEYRLGSGYILRGTDGEVLKPLTPVISE